MQLSINKLKKNLTWFLIFLFVFSNVANLIVPAQKVRAAEQDPNNPGFYKATPDKVIAPDNLQPIINDNKTVTLKWEIAKASSSGPAMPDGFLVKTGNKAPFLCKFFINRDVIECPSKVSLKEEPFIHSSSEAWENFFKSSSSSVKYTLVDQNVNADQMSDNIRVGVQGVLWQIDLYSNANMTDLKQMPTSDLGPGFSDDNITAYIKNKISIFAGGKKPEGVMAGVEQKDIDNFSAFMNAFKNCSDCWARQAYKSIIDNPNEDPFKFLGANDSSGKWQSLLTQAEITELRNKYYVGYNPGSDNAEMKYFNDTITAMYREFGKIIDDANASGSCANLDLKLKESLNFHDLYTGLGSAIGALAGGFLTRSPWGVVGGGVVGAATGDTLKATVSADQIDPALQQLKDIAKNFGKLYYGLLYISMKEAKIGLEQYSSQKDSLPQYTGLNPYKVMIMSGYYKVWSDAFSGCFKNIMADVNALQADVAGNTCGLDIKSMGTTYFIATALCAILKMFGEIANWLTTSLFKSIYDAYRSPPEILGHLSFLTAGFSITKAHAAESVSSLIQVLDTKQSPADYKWVVTSWKWILALTNLFLVVILLFLGIVNILHIQYDTYAIKKMLPLLIIGVILANFSLLIMRMLVDAANILTKSFLDSYPGGGSELVKDLISKVVISDQQHSMLGDWGKVGVLLLAVIFGAFGVIAFVILGVMFYIRFASIILLAIVAPLAFVLLAFPPTQGIFKQWWSWATKMTFMKPIAFFLLYMASFVKNSGAGATITGWLIMTVIVYIAIIVPWKLGGVVMGVWGGAMGTLFGTKKGGWARKPVDEWWQRRKDKAGATVKARFPGLFKGAEKDRGEVEQLKKIADQRIKQKARGSGSISQLEDIAQGEENTLKKLINDQMDQVRAAELTMPFLIRVIAQTSGLGQAGKTIKAGADAALSQKNIEKRTEDETNLAALKMGKENTEFKADLDDLAKNGDGITMRELINGVYQDEYIVDQETGEKKVKKGAAYEMMNRAAQYRQRAAIASSLGDQDEANAFLEGARNMERDVGEYVRSHTKTKDGKTINYDAFMDDLYAGRVLSLTTSWNMEDSQVESINSPADKNIASIFEGGNGDRLMRATAQRMQEAMLGKRRGMNVVDLRAWERLMSTLQIQWGRGSNADRATAIGKLIEELADRKFYGEDSYKGGNVLGEQLAGYALKISENPALLRGVLAEQILASRRRGATLPGLDKFDIKDVMVDGKRATNWNKDTVSAALKLMEERGEVDSKKYLIENPQILSQIGTAAPGISMQDSISYLNFVTDGASRLKILGGGGNPMNNIVAGRDIGSNEWFQPLQVTEKKDIQKIRQEVQQKEIERQEIDSESHILTQTSPETFANQITNEAVNNRDVSGMLRNYQGTVLNVLQNLPAVLSNMKLGNVAISNADFERIGAIIANASANNLSELQTHLKKQGENVSVTLPSGLTDDATGIAQFQKNIRDLLTGIQNINFLDLATKAQTASKYGPVNSSKNVDELKSELAQIANALSQFDTTIKNLEDTRQSIGSFPQQSSEQIATLIAKLSDVIPLRGEVLKSDPMQSGEILRKMQMAWRGAIAAKSNNEELSEQNILKNILAEERKQTIARATTETPAGAAPTQPVEKPAAKPEEEQSPGGQETSGTKEV